MEVKAKPNTAAVARIDGYGMAGRLLSLHMDEIDPNNIKRMGIFFKFHFGCFCDKYLLYARRS